jgi:hypothetical protein
MMMALVLYFPYVSTKKKEFTSKTEMRRGVSVSFFGVVVAFNDHSISLFL